MPYDRFLIAPLNTGLQNDLRPWLIPDDAFQVLTNMYVFRGRVRKRFGSNLMIGTTVPTSGTEQLISRARLSLGTTDGSGNIPPGIVTGGAAVAAVGNLFSIGDAIYTVAEAGSHNMLQTVPTTTAVFDTASGGYTFIGAPANKIVYFYPALPIMGIGTYYDGTLAGEPTFVFDTRFAYKWTGNGWDQLGPATWTIMTGSNSQFFWTNTWRGLTANIPLFFITNFNATNSTTFDPMQYWDGSIWATMTPQYSATATDQILTARIIITFKNRLLLLNTVENFTTAGPTVTALRFVNRVRFSASIQSPTDANAFRTDITGQGGFADAPTKEQIISAQILKDRLIVFFESSTWELVFTNNDLVPFLWQRINTELGSESTFSTIPFDKVLLTVGNVGVHACNGANVERIDEKIPDEVFDIHNEQDGPTRVYGIRDFETEMAYWTFPEASSERDEAGEDIIFPNRILVYNYRTGSWAFNSDCITAFGYFALQDLPQGLTWQQATDTWEEMDEPWASAFLEPSVSRILAGNQEGFLYLVSPDRARNCPSMQITNMTYNASVSTVTFTVINHNLADEDNAQGTPYYVLVENCKGFTDLNNQIFAVVMVTDYNTFSVILPNAITPGTYTGGGTISLVSNVNVWSKQWNPYIDQGNDFYLAKIDFGVEKTANGQVTVDYFPSSTTRSMLTDGTASNAIMGNGILETSPYDQSLYPLEQIQNRLWHSVYFQTVGDCVQIRVYMSDTQMRDPAVSLSGFVIEGLVLYTQLAGRLQ